MARTLRHPSSRSITLDGILHALAHPVRRKIMLKLMGCAGMNCGKACEALPPSTISFHHRVLRDAGLIRSHRKGVELINTARKAEIERRFPGLLPAIFQNHKMSRTKK